MRFKLELTMASSAIQGVEMREQLAAEAST